MKLAGFIVLVVLVGGLSLVWLGFAQAQAADARFVVPGWGSEATLQVRRDTTGILFAPGIRFVEPPAGAPRQDAYRFDPGRLELEPVSAETWRAAPGEVVDCDRAGLVPSRVQVEGGTLSIDGRPVPLGGQVRHARVSPDGRFVAVLSASGIPIPSVSPIPTLGGTAVVGWRQHRLLSIPSGDQVGPNILIDFGVSDRAPCWSPDGRVVSYANPEFTNVAFVLVPE